MCVFDCICNVPPHTPPSGAHYLLSGPQMCLITGARLYIKPLLQLLLHSPIMHLSCLLLLVSLGARAGAFDLGQTTRCVPVPPQMSVCQDVPYSEMRLPNLLGHTSLEEAVPRSEDWRTLLHTGCHPQARALVCSLVAPVCLDRYQHTHTHTPIAESFWRNCTHTKKKIMHAFFFLGGGVKKICSQIYMVFFK